MELFIVEGVSAESAVKSVVRKDRQQTFSVQGKIPNVLRKGQSAILNNPHTKALFERVSKAHGPTHERSVPMPVDAFGDTDTSDAYIILCDADVDGAHASTLLILFFCRMLPDVVRDGRVSVVRPPLYSFSAADRDSLTFAYSERDFQQSRHLERQFGRSLTNIKRYKGIASLDPSILFKCCVDPLTRRLHQIKLCDGEHLARTFGS